MNRKNFGGTSGVVIDWCKGHGFWFDTHELEKIMAFVQAGGLDRARAREIARAEERAQQAERRVKGSADFPEIELEMARSGRGGPSLLDAIFHAAGDALSSLFWR